MMAAVVGCPRSPAGVLKGQVVAAAMSVTIRATPAAVHAVLADGWAYAGWVVGASHVPAVQADWPAVGSRLFHASGTWPLLMNDHTVVEQVDPGRQLASRFRVGPRWVGDIGV